MFKIAQSESFPNIPSDDADRQQVDSSYLDQFCDTDRWFGDLTTGMFRLGKTGASMHRLDSEECGLLALLKAYQHEDRLHILKLLEKASSAPSKFCFGTNITDENGHHQPMICVGESTGTSGEASGVIMGSFIFPRFHISATEQST